MWHALWTVKTEEQERRQDLRESGDGIVHDSRADEDADLEWDDDDGDE